LRRPAEPVRTEPSREVRKLIVGREITLSGEIAACDHLIVEGTVEASVKDCHRLEVLEAGLFRGTVEINEAEIAGRFDGQIVVQNRLSVRSTGRIEGKIQYGELAVEAGGTLDGEVRGHSKAKAQPKAKPETEAPLLEQPAAKPDEAAPAAATPS
jgi:cytoskeletal protein CcmA (bactofilin family)